MFQANLEYIYSVYKQKVKLISSEIIYFKTLSLGTYKSQSVNIFQWHVKTTRIQFATKYIFFLKKSFSDRILGPEIAFKRCKESKNVRKSKG